jgi:endonuclease/exonuclease/phosphatase family metal-dependent hydrolase
LRQAHGRGLRSLSAAIVAAFILILLLPATGQASRARIAGAQAVGNGAHGANHDNGRGKVVGVMTRNLYLGANLLPAIESESLAEFVAANGQILREVTENDFPVRAEGLAEEILAAKPDLVGLQEVALWRTAPVDFEVLAKGPSATTVRYDYLQELLGELNAGKGKGGKGKSQYEVVVVQDEFDLEAPADEDGNPATGPLGADINGRLTMRDVILARRGAGVQTWNAQGANFKVLLPAPILGNVVPIKRGWTATDAKVRGSHPFRFVNTHLEAFEPNVRAAQAGELVAPDGPATSELPVVLVGDLNSDDDTVEGADRLAYQVLLGAGMVERSTDDPLSCCLDSSLLAVGKGGSEADFDHQVDHIMTRDPEVVTLQSSAVSDIQPVNGFWSSDHAGLFSALRFAR